jgi:hypothetical protein
LADKPTRPEAESSGDEPEATPEMIRAARDVLADYDPEVDHLGSTAARIVRAVLREIGLPHVSGRESG